MKKLLLSLSLITISLFGMNATEQTISQQILTESLEFNKTLFMDENQFNAFTKHYINEATQKLHIFKYFVNNPNKWHEHITKNPEKNYLSVLIGYIRSYDELLVYPTNSILLAFEGNNIKFHENQILKSIEKINSEAALSLDPKKECQNTISLLKDINEKYYKQLRFTSKIKFKLNQIGIWSLDRCMLSFMILDRILHRGLINTLKDLSKKN